VRAHLFFSSPHHLSLQVEVYTLAAHFFIKESPHSLDFLTDAGIQQLVDPLQQWETWPSWVPSFPFEFLSPISYRRPRFRADAKEPRNLAQLPHEHTRLNVDGVRFTKLSYVMRFEEDVKLDYGSLCCRLLKAYDLFRAPGSGTAPQCFDESSLLPTLIRITLGGSYENIHTNPGNEQTWLQRHNMYEDFIAWMVRVALSDLKKGQFNSLHALQDRFQIVDQAVACAWLSQAGNSVPEGASSGDSSCLTAAEIKQVYRRKMSSISPKLQKWIDRSEEIL
jgi:hypothetical protein